MWTKKYFKTYQDLKTWMEKNKNKYQIDIILISNGYGVEYRPLRRVY